MATPISYEVLEKGDQAVWLAYALRVKQELVGGGKLGDGDRVFICPGTTMGLGLGGKPETVNADLWEVANNLVEEKRDSPFYAKDTNGGHYFGRRSQ